MFGVTCVNQDGIIPRCEQDKMKTLPHITFNMHVSGLQLPTSQERSDSILRRLLGGRPTNLICSRVMLTTNSTLQEGMVPYFHSTYMPSSNAQ